MGKRKEKRPAGVVELHGRWYWRPGTKAEREKRKAAGQPQLEPLGPAGTVLARKRWAELTGLRDPEGSKVESGTVADLIAKFRKDGLAVKPNGKPRSEKTVKEYEGALGVMEGLFGSCTYAKTAADAMAGKALGTVDLQRYIRADRRTIANRRLSTLSAMFTWAISEGYTAYNPCLGVARTAEEPRSREVMEWEAECLAAVADARGDAWIGLAMRFERVTGWRVSDIRLLQRHQLVPPGIRLVARKRAKRMLFYWSDELRAIIAEASKLPGSTSSMFIFPAENGEAVTLDAFEKRWGRLKRATNRMLAQCDVPLQIEDLHFHDLRSMAGDDAEEAGQDRHVFLGNSKAVAERHYARREVKVRPIR